MEKKDGGKISHWQLHTITVPESGYDLFKERFPEIDPKDVKVVTGTIVEDPTKRWEPGWHFRSTYIVKLDRQKNTIETLNTIYHFDPETEGQDTIFDLETGNKDMGNKVLSIFY